MTNAIVFRFIARMLLAPIRPDNLSPCEDVTLHRRFDILASRSLRETERGIESVHGEDVPMRSAWWTGSAVSDLPETVFTVHAVRPFSFADRRFGRRNVPDDPMCEGTAGCVRIGDDES